MKIAVSACLLGEPCRYDGRAKAHESIVSLSANHDVLPICPECAGGLPTPRVPSEITPNGSSPAGFRVMNAEGVDVTEAFTRGAYACLREIQEFGCEAAILKAKSPSCGPGLIYDGTFSGTLTEGWGIAAALIRDAGIPVFDETNAVEAVDEKRAAEVIGEAR